MRSRCACKLHVRTRPLVVLSMTSLVTGLCMISDRCPGVYDLADGFEMHTSRAVTWALPCQRVTKRPASGT